MTSPVRRAAVAGVLVVAVAGVGLVLARLHPDAIAHALAWLGRVERDWGAAGWLIAALGQTLIALCGIVPASLGAISAGALYGIAGGFTVSAVGTLAGAVIAFRLARSLFRATVAGWIARRAGLARFDVAIAKDGWRTVCLLRLSPVMPFAFTSYALGLTSLEFGAYLAGTLAALPSLLLYVVLGALARDGLASLASPVARPAHWALLVAGIAATAILTLRLGRMVARAIRLDPALPNDATG